MSDEYGPTLEELQMPAEEVPLYVAQQEQLQAEALAAGLSPEQYQQQKQLKQILFFGAAGFLLWQVLR